MARRGQHPKGRGAEVQLGGGGQVDVDRGYAPNRNAVDLACGPLALQEVVVLRRAGELHAVVLLQVADTQQVVEVAVGIGCNDGLQPLFGDEVVEAGIFGGVAAA